MCEVSAQSRDRLEKQKSQLKKDIAYKNTLLKKTAKSKNLSINQLVILKKKIQQRGRLIVTITTEIALIEESIALANDSIAYRQNELKRLKEEYAKMIVHAYKNRSNYDRLMFILASEDFNQAYKRLKYFQQYSAYRKKQGEAIAALKLELEERVLELERQHAEKEELILALREERLHLGKEKDDEQNTVNQLAKKESELKKEIEKKRKEADRLTDAIRDIIRREIAEQNKTKGTNSKVFKLTPEAKALSADFAGNKGKLPWPVTKGVITESYGEHWHPVLKGIKVKNNGVNISTEVGSAARCVFGGEVTRVLIIQGSGKVVIVRHGEYLSVYSNLQEVFVQKGDRVKTKDKVGVVVQSDDKAELHFELWKGSKTMDPESWLYIP